MSTLKLIMYWCLPEESLDCSVCHHSAGGSLQDSVAWWDMILPPCCDVNTTAQSVSSHVWKGICSCTHILLDLSDHSNSRTQRLLYLERLVVSSWSVEAGGCLGAVVRASGKYRRELTGLWWWWRCGWLLLLSVSSCSLLGWRQSQGTDPGR